MRLVSRRRIIPARAGFTVLCYIGTGNWMDHPRSRGVYFVQSFRLGASQGSSPLARGLLRTIRQSGDGGGIIPARAGFTATMGRSGMLRTDHPRSRGVYAREATMVSEPPGSSPLARGLLLLLAHIRVILGIIPARAGFTP